jgi:hypothetical protein
MGTEALGSAWRSSSRPSALPRARAAVIQGSPSVAPTAAALWRANRAAFVGRPPRPLAGALLQVPPEAAVLGIDQAEARAVVAAFAAEPLAVATAAPSASASQSARTAPARGAPSVAPATGSAAPGGRAAIDPTSPRVEPAARDRVVLSAPRPAEAGAARTAADAAFEAELAATVKRIAALLIAAGLGPFAGTLALAAHTAGVLGRLFAEAIENAPAGPAFLRPRVGRRLPLACRHGRFARAV